LEKEGTFFETLLVSIGASFWVCFFLKNRSYSETA